MSELINSTINNIDIYLTIAKYIGATIVMSMGALGACLAQGKIASKACESIASNINAEKSIKTTFFIGMVFVETSAIYCLLIAIVLLFIV